MLTGLPQPTAQLTTRATPRPLRADLPGPQIDALPALGADHFALRRGHEYGKCIRPVVVDMATVAWSTCCPTETGFSAEWLHDRRDVRVICPGPGRSGA